MRDDWFYIYHATAADRAVVLRVWDRLEARSQHGERRAKAVRFSRDLWWDLTRTGGRFDRPLFAPMKWDRALARLS